MKISITTMISLEHCSSSMKSFLHSYLYQEILSAKELIKNNCIFLDSLLKSTQCVNLFFAKNLPFQILLLSNHISQINENRIEWSRSYRRRRSDLDSLPEWSRNSSSTGWKNSSRISFANPIDSSVGTNHLFLGSKAFLSIGAAQSSKSGQKIDNLILLCLDQSINSTRVQIDITLQCSSINFLCKNTSETYSSRNFRPTKKIVQIISRLKTLRVLSSKLGSFCEWVRINSKLWDFPLLTPS